jgi:carbon monoxide dehydrogenase subunit G
MRYCPPTKFLLCLLLSALLLMAEAWANPQNDSDIEVKIRIDGKDVIVDLNLLVPATRQQVWAVLTDFEHMAGFISNLKECKVLNASGSSLKIFQRGSAQYGPVSFAFESTREIQLTPYEKIQSHLISGNMHKMEGITQLIDEGEQTRIRYHTDSIPGVWIPPLVGKVFIEHEVREQFQEIRDEIIKRNQSVSPVLAPGQSVLKED